jgi:CRISPR-associated protein Cas6
MYWQEDTALEQTASADEIVDLNYRVNCRTLPLDHAYALSEAVCRVLPWLRDDERAGIHTIFGPGSQNGWYRPEETEGAILHVSRRTRMSLRLPKDRVAQARALTGAVLAVDGHRLEVGEATVRPLEGMPTIHARYVVSSEDDLEETFLAWVAGELQGMGIRVRKVLCGKSHFLRAPNARIFTRSVMVADLQKEESIRLQQRGLGPMRTLGCGVFVPHKGIAPVKRPADD